MLRGYSCRPVPEEISRWRTRRCQAWVSGQQYVEVDEQDLASAVEAVSARCGVIGQNVRTPLHTEGEADALTHRRRRFRDGVRIVELRQILHDEKDAWLEVNVNGTPRRGLLANRHPPRRPEREQRDREALPDLVQMIIVGRDTVAAVPV